MYPRGRIPQRLHLLAPLVLLLAAAVSPASAQGRLVPGLAWCAGVTDPGDFPAVHADGFDAVRIDVPWQTNPSWESLDHLIQAADEADLRVILAVQTTAVAGATAAADPDLPEYVARVKVWLDSAAQHFRENKTVLGWMVSDEPDASLRLSEAGFRRFLAGRYPDIRALNAAWQVTLNSLDEASAAAALTVARQKPLGVSRASIDLALYRQDALVRLMQLWAKTIRSVDERHPILTGTIGRYRSLIGVPEEYDGVVARIAPGVMRGLDAPAEAVAIARRSGQRAAIASISGLDLVGGLGGALLQGAVGIQVEDWAALRGNNALGNALASALANWRKSDCLTTQPRPTTAILYEPFAESFPNPSPFLTGFLSGCDLGEMEPLVTTFRNGTRFGQVGYVAHEDLTTGALDGYRVLFCPATLSLTPDDLRALSRFAENGGIVVADLGLGCYEAGGPLASWSSELATLVGFRSVVGTVAGTGTLRIYDGLPIFPSLRSGDVSVGARGLMPFGGPVALVEPMEGTSAFGAVVDKSLPGKRLFGGILAHPIGRGWVLYASMRLWHHWSPLDPLFTLFHYDLMSRRPALKLLNAPFLGGDIQVAAFDRGIAVRNTGARARLVGIETSDERLYAGACLNICRPAMESGGRLQAGLAPGNLGLYEKTPIRCVIERGAGTVAVEEYGPDRIKISFCGGRPRVTLSPEGTAQMRATAPQPARLLIASGRYPIRPGSVHVIRVRDTDSDTISEFRARANSDGTLELEKSFNSDVVSITPYREPSKPAASAAAPAPAAASPAPPADPDPASAPRPTRNPPPAEPAPAIPPVPPTP